MKNWKKGLACLLAGVMMLAMLTACEGVTAISAKVRSTTQTECENLAGKIGGGLTYDSSLSNRAYQIASWVADSISIKEKDEEFQRIVNVDNDNWSYLAQETLNEFLFNSGCTVADGDFVIGLELTDTKDTLTGDVTTVRAPKLENAARTLRDFASGKSKLGAAYIVVGNNTYVVAVFG